MVALVVVQAVMEVVVTEVLLEDQVLLVLQTLEVAEEVTHLILVELEVVVLLLLDILQH
jgi:hypothetical protein